MSGRSVSHYQILEPLGSGGMGEVFKARDTRLNRLVAIKILRPDRVSEANRKQRFIQEAQAASVLNHPNIVTIHDIKGGVDFLVMELVAGRTLDAVIPRQGIRLSEVLRIAVQVAEGLRRHAAGIIHRDLKPSNILAGWIVLHTRNSETARQMFITPFQFGRVPPQPEWIRITDGKGLDGNPAWSPDGPLLARRP